MTSTAVFQESSKVELYDDWAKLRAVCRLELDDINVSPLRLAIFQSNMSQMRFASPLPGLLNIRSSYYVS
jgi:hypothetical protein